MHVTHRRVAAVFALACASFLLFLGRQDIANTHEARVAQTAREMAAAGWPWTARPATVPAVRLAKGGGRTFLKADPSVPPLRVNPWVVPVLTGEVRLQKPPLPYWCAAVLFRLFGESAWAARLAPAVMGALATLLVADLARRLIGRRAGVVAALLWVSSYFVVFEFRKAMADPYVAFATTAGVWAWVRASAARTGDRRRGAASAWIILFYVAFTLAAYAKGPVILVHLCAALVAFHACDPRRPVPRDLPGHAVGILLMLAVTLPWPLAVVRSVPHAIEQWRYESVGELADNRRNAAPFWAYLPKLPYLALPWTPLWVAALAYVLARTRGRGNASEGVRRRRLLVPLAWYGAVVVFFSFVNLKKDAYLLPVTPAQVLLIAQIVTAAIAYGRLRPPPAWLYALRNVQIGVAAGVALAVIVLLLARGRPAFPVASVAGAALAAAMASLAAAPLRRATARGRWFGPAALSCAVSVMLYVAVDVGAKENRRSPRPFASAVARRLGQNGAGKTRALRRAGLPPAVAFYLPPDTGDEETAGEVLVVAGRNATPAGVAAEFTARTSRPVADVRRVTLDEAVHANRWTLFELTVGNRRRYAAAAAPHSRP